jgi:hypothetical protein
MGLVKMMASALSMVPIPFPFDHVIDCSMPLHDDRVPPGTRLVTARVETTAGRC